MSIILSNTFSSDPGSSFFTKYQYGAGTVTSAYNAVNQAVDLINPNGNIPAVFVAPYQLSLGVENFVWEAELELVTGSAASLWGMVLFRVNEGVPAYYLSAPSSSELRLTYLTGWTVLTATTLQSVTPPVPLSVGVRQVWKVSRSGPRITLHIDGVLCLDFNHKVDSDYYAPALYARNGTVRVHSITLTTLSREDIANHNAKFTGLSWANKETKGQAWVGEVGYKKAQITANKVSHFIRSASCLAIPPGRGELGYISGVITKKGVPTQGRAIVCLDERFNLIAETTSMADGSYRFDNLLINRLYTIHTYDTYDFNYAPVGADRRTPEAYS